MANISLYTYNRAVVFILAAVLLFGLCGSAKETVEDAG